MIEIEKPKIETVDVNEEGTYGKFVVEPLERIWHDAGELASPHLVILTPGGSRHIDSNRWRAS